MQPEHIIYRKIKLGRSGPGNEWVLCLMGIVALLMKQISIQLFPSPETLNRFYYQPTPRFLFTLQVAVKCKGDF